MNNKNYWQSVSLKIYRAKMQIIESHLSYWSRRFEDSLRLLIDTPDKVLILFDFIRNEHREHLVCITLDASNRLIARRVISIGTATSSLVHPRELFIDAISDRATGIILAHNHPSGNAAPSVDDLHTSKRIKEAADILGIPLVDNFIVTELESISIM